MYQIYQKLILAEKEIIRLNKLLDKYDIAKKQALREKSSFKFESEEQIRTLREELAETIRAKNQQISDLKGDVSAYRCAAQIDSDRLKNDLTDRNTDLRAAKNLAENLRKEKLQLQTEIALSCLKNGQLLSKIDHLNFELKDAKIEIRHLDHRQGYAQEIIAENHEYALQLECEYSNCNDCKKRYTPKRPYLFDAPV